MNDAHEFDAEALSRIAEAARVLNVAMTQVAANLTSALTAVGSAVQRAGIVSFDQHRVPQIGDDELQAWSNFISETKQRSSRIVKR